MQIQFTARSLVITDDQREYIDSKIAALEGVGKELADPANIARVEVDYHEIADLDKRVEIEVTLNVPHSIIRATQEASTVEEGIDLISDKLFKQIERYRGKLHRRDKGGEWVPTQAGDDFDKLAAEELDQMPKVTKRQRFTLYRQMHEEEALEQMELIGHDFYLFLNKDTNRFSVVYRRRNGSYGIIEPKIETNSPNSRQELAEG